MEIIGKGFRLKTWTKRSVEYCIEWVEFGRGRSFVHGIAWVRGSFGFQRPRLRAMVCYMEPRGANFGNTGVSSYNSRQ